MRRQSLLTLVCLHSISITSEKFSILTLHMLWWCVHLLLRLAIGLESCRICSLHLFLAWRTTALLVCFVSSWIPGSIDMDRGSKIQSLDREMYPRGWFDIHIFARAVRPKKSSEHFTWQAKLAEERRRDRVQRMNRVEACF